MSTGLISFPENFCEFTSSKEELITKVFLGIKQNYKNIDCISERAILSAKNKDVDSLNFIIQKQIPGELHSLPMRLVLAAKNKDVDRLNYIIQNQIPEKCIRHR